MLILCTMAAMHRVHAVQTGLDEQLAAMAQGDKDALAAFYHAAREGVYAFALSLLKNAHDAEDATQDTFVSVWQSAHQYQSQGKPMAWVLTVTRNLCLKKLRERQKLADIPREDWEPWLRADEGLSQEDRLVLFQCMDRLSDQERHIVVLHAVGGLKHREIAAMLELPLPTVLSKYARALKKLRQHL